MEWFSGRRPSAALVVALFALFVALGGTTYAVVGLAPNSVGTKQLRNGAVTAAKVKPGGLVAADFKAGTLLKGAAGATGAAGSTGSTGATGATGAQGIPGVPGQAGLPATKYFATVADQATGETGTATSAVRVRAGVYNVSFGSADLTNCTAIGGPGENAESDTSNVDEGMTVAAFPGLAWSGGSLVATPNTVAVTLLNAVAEGTNTTFEDSAFELAVFC